MLDIDEIERVMQFVKTQNPEPRVGQGVIQIYRN